MYQYSGKVFAGLVIMSMAAGVAHAAPAVQVSVQVGDTTVKKTVPAKAAPKAKASKAKKVAQVKTPVVPAVAVAPVATPVSAAPVSATPVVMTQSAPVNTLVVQEKKEPQTVQSKMILGIEAGGNIASSSVKAVGENAQTYASGAGTAFGLSFALPVKGDRWSATLGGHYVSRLIHADSTSQSFMTSWAKFSPTMNYWIIPSSLSVGMGGYVAIPVGDVTREETDLGLRSSSRQLNSMFRPDLGLAFSVGGRVRMNQSTHMLMEGRYNHGLMNVVDRNAAAAIPGVNLEETKVRELQLMVGVGFELI